MTGEIPDDEQLYRRVRRLVGQQVCYRDEGGKVVFLHAAFNDRSRQPSVDRASLKIERNPHHSRYELEDGIVSLVVGAVRRLARIEERNRKGKPSGDAYIVNVSPDPKVGNCAHALILVTPPGIGSNAFMRLKDALVRLANQAGWTVEPNTPLLERPGLLRDAANCALHRLRRRL